MRRKPSPGWKQNGVEEVNENEINPVEQRLRREAARFDRDMTMPSAATVSTSCREIERHRCRLFRATCSDSYYSTARIQSNGNGRVHRAARVARSG